MAAGLPSGRKAFPSKTSWASNFPGPQLFSTLRTVGSGTPSNFLNALKSGAEATIAPTSRSRFGHPSSRWPIPEENESSTVEWHKAQLIPIDFIPLPSGVRKAFTPTTAFSFTNASVVAGSSRSTLPCFICSTKSAGSASASTFNPSANAFLGESFATASCSLSVSPQKASLPKVSKRKVCLPSASICCALWLIASSYPTTSGVVCARSGSSLITNSNAKARLTQATVTNLWRLEEWKKTNVFRRFI